MGIFQIKVLKANEGDCILIEVGGVPSTRIMVDCGPKSAWRKNILPDMKKLNEAGQKIDLLIITHIDSDHIGGALELLNSTAVPISEIWFNGLMQIIEADCVEDTPEEKRFLESAVPLFSEEQMTCGNSDISFAQSYLLSVQLGARKELWNTHFLGGPILKSVEPFEFAPGVFLTVLLPEKENLSNLLLEYENNLRSVKISASVRNSPAMQEAFERYFLSYGRPIYEEIDISDNSSLDIKKLSSVVAPADMSVTNASSIVFILEYDGKSALFLGDIPAQDAVRALKEWGHYTGKQLFFDLIKMPHHGSKQNCIKILDCIDGRNFLISGNGSRYGHPNIETIAKIINRPAECVRRIILNYHHNKLDPFMDKKLMEQYQYEIITSNEIMIE